MVGILVLGSFWGVQSLKNSNELEVSMKIPFFFGEALCLTMFGGLYSLLVSRRKISGYGTKSSMFKNP